MAPVCSSLKMRSYELDWKVTHTALTFILFYLLCLGLQIQWDVYLIWNHVQIHKMLFKSASFICYLNIQMYIQIKNTFQTCDRRLCPDTVTWIEYDSTNWCILYPTNLYETCWIWLVHPHLYFVAIWWQQTETSRVAGTLAETGEYKWQIYAQ